MMKKSGFILAVFMLTLFLGKPLVKGDDGSFISRRGVQFMSNGGVFYANGFNAYWMMIQAANPSTRPKVSSILQEASSYGLTIARTWAFSDGGSLPLQISPGSYNEQMFQGLDFVVAEAKRCGIKLIMSLVNNYADYGGKPQYAQWANLANEDDFFTNPVTKGIYKNHIKTVLTRVNTITKVAYKDDPTIMAWELMNEPRCKSDTSGRTLQNWVGEMAAYVKSIDSNHLLEIGLEGFYGASTPEKIQMNPHSVMYGTDFIANNQIPGIDFATVHSYPDQWLSDSSIDDQFGFLNQWVYQHIADAQNTLQMPVVFAEFGKSYKLPGFNPADSVTLYSVIYNGIYSSASKGGAAASGLFWQLVAEGMDTFRDGYEIVLKDSASLSSLIADESQKMSNLCKRDRRRKLLDFSS